MIPLGVSLFSQVRSFAIILLLTCTHDKCSFSKCFFFFLLHHCDWTSGSRSSVVSLPCIHNNNYYYYVKRIASLIESVRERPGWSWKFTCSIDLSHHQIAAGCGCWPQWLKGSDAAILALAKFVIVLWFRSLFRCLMKVWGVGLNCCLVCLITVWYLC